MTLFWVETVAVAVSAIMWTCGGIKLRTSPNLENSFLNAPLAKRNTKTSYVGTNTLNKLELHIFFKY